MVRSIETAVNRGNLSIFSKVILGCNKRSTPTIRAWHASSSKKHVSFYIPSQTRIERVSLFHSSSSARDVRTFASENPELATGKEDKIFFEDFEPGEEIPLVPLPPFDDGSGKVVASPELKDLADRILQLSFLEIHQLTQLFSDHFNIDGADMMMMGNSGGGGGGGGGTTEAAAPVAEKTIFELKLTGFDEKSKIKIIKEIRSITGLGLKEAKDLVEGAPKMVKKDIKKPEAEELKAKLEAVGATVEIV